MNNSKTVKSVLLFHLSAGKQQKQVREQTAAGLIYYFLAGASTQLNDNSCAGNPPS